MAGRAPARPRPAARTAPARPAGRRGRHPGRLRRAGPGPRRRAAAGRGVRRGDRAGGAPGALARGALPGHRAGRRARRYGQGARQAGHRHRPAGPDRGRRGGRVVGRRLVGHAAEAQPGAVRAGALGRAPGARVHAGAGPDRRARAGRRRLAGGVAAPARGAAPHRRRGRDRRRAGGRPAGLPRADARQRRADRRRAGRRTPRRPPRPGDAQAGALRRRDRARRPARPRGLPGRRLRADRPHSRHLPGATVKLHHRVDGPSGAPLLVLGPSLGTTMEIWRPQLPALTDSWRVLRYDLPGHGGSPPAKDFTVGDLAQAVLDLVEDERFAAGGISLGGAIAATIATRAPVRELVLCCSSARFGEPGPWHGRAALVRGKGVAALVPTLRTRWFTPGFDGQWVLDQLTEVDARSYAACCEALAAFDLTGRLGEITARTLVIAGAEDPATPLDHALTLAGGIPGASLTVVPHASHLANVERPEPVTQAIAAHLADSGGGLEAGMRTRREVLGDAHVDRAVAATTDFTRDFQELITRYAWDEIWNRPGLDRRTRSCVTLTALVARGQLEELAMHVRAALRNGLTRDEIKEVLLQTAVYCGVPAANAAFAVARRTLADIDANGL
ncbi:4-carboxymuconolactone decarboxylase [Nonomuraea phyllanthi]|uniref:4-carboxymuconolactone decarboxylase n=1 Tax=Nonomuraea phyllanthi TaxID=2219224 RepID=A0A5C4WBX4_9ACTN|nr:4-carboxymuconolactone decarboxylase [Nonomuraea phyllanthi]